MTTTEKFKLDKRSRLIIQTALLHLRRAAGAETHLEYIQQCDMAVESCKALTPFTPPPLKG